VLSTILSPPLQVTAESEFTGYPVRFAITSDRTGGHVPGIHGQIAAEVERMKPDFLMTVGDMIEGYVDDSARIVGEWKEYDSVMGVIKCPIHFTPGNHDIWSDLSERLYRQERGEPYYSFDHRGLHFVVLDVSRSDSSEDIPDEQVAWLADDLQKSQSAAHTFVFFHKPFWYESVADNKPDTLHSLFVKYGVDAVFSGHYHDYAAGDYDGIRYTMLGSSGAETEPGPTGLEYHFMWVTVASTGIYAAPIKMGAMLPLDEIRVEERKVFSPLKRMGLTLEGPVPVNQHLKVDSSLIGVTINNTFSDFAVDDTIRWEIPDGWQVDPENMPVKVLPGASRTLYFKTISRGDLYPVPTVTTNMTYAEGKKITAQNYLKLARHVNCYRAEEPVIDGEVSEEFWKEPVVRFFAPGGSKAAIDPVKFYFAYDDHNLYLAAYCTDHKIDSVSADVKERDGSVYGEDCIGYFIEPVIESDTIYQIYINPVGVVFDQKIWKDEDGWADADRDWNGEYTVESKMGPDYWSIEARISLGQFGTVGEEGRKMRINFRRKQPRLGNADWQTPIDYYADTYGYLIMK
jgi:hypothetical protein